MPVKLLINAIPLLGEESGIGNYARHICEAALANDACDTTFFYGYHSKRLAAPAANGRATLLGSLKGLAKKGSLPRRIAKKALYLANLAANTFSSRTWDCYFEPNFVLLPTLKARRSVITVHDFSCFHYPQWHPVERTKFMEKCFWQSASHADHLVTVSGAIREEAISLYGIKPDRITAIPNGVNHELFYPRPRAEIEELQKRYHLPPDFLLYVGALEPRKNLDNLIAAHSLLPVGLRKKYPLVIIGSQGWNNDSIFELIHKNRGYVHLLGYVPTNELPAFYSASTFFAYPSWYEGFGLPVLEAMSCGKPALISQAKALVDLCGDGGISARADDPEDLRDRMAELLEDDELRSRLANAALARSRAFSWAKSTSAHLSLFKWLASR